MDFEFGEVESLDKVPESFRHLYSGTPNTEGKYGVDPTHKGVAESINGFNKTNKQLRHEIKTKVVDLSPLAEFGSDPASIKAGLQAKLDELKEQYATGKTADVAKQIDSVKTALAEAHKKEIDKRDQRNTGLQTQLYGLLVENAAVSAIAELKGVPELLMPFISSQVKVVEEDGKLHPRVLDAAGEVRFGATGSPMTIKELVMEMKANAKYGRLFESESNSGGGMPTRGGNLPPRPTGQVLTATQKISAGLNKNQRNR